MHSGTQFYRGRGSTLVKSMDWGATLCVVDTITPFPTTDAHILTLTTEDYVTLYGKRDSAGMIKVGDLEGV